MDYNNKYVMRIWMTKEFDDYLEQVHNKYMRMLLWGPTEEEKKQMEENEKRPDKNVKLAYVLIGGNRVMCGVDNQTMQGYRLDDTSPTWKRPLEPIDYDEFVRWCRLMDI